MFNLETCVHLDEVEFLAFNQEFEGPEAAIPDLPARLYAARADLRDQFCGKAGGRRFLDDLLVAPLHRAITTAQPQRIAVMVGQHLDFNMARMHQEFLQIDIAVAECTACLLLRQRERVGKVRRHMDHAHATPAAAAGRLDDHRVADTVCERPQHIRLLRQRPVRAGDAWHTGRPHGPLSSDLVAHDADRRGLWSDEGQAGSLDAGSKACIF